MRMDDLQKAGIGIIQIDEPALREGYRYVVMSGKHT